MAELQQTNTIPDRLTWIFNADTQKFYVKKLSDNVAMIQVLKNTAQNFSI